MLPDRRRKDRRFNQANPHPRRVNFEEARKVFSANSRRRSTPKKTDFHPAGFPPLSFRPRTALLG
jgi:hypothetical protein